MRLAWAVALAWAAIVAALFGWPKVLFCVPWVVPEERVARKKTEPHISTITIATRVRTFRFFHNGFGAGAGVLLYSPSAGRTGNRPVTYCPGWPARGTFTTLTCWVRRNMPV